MMLYLLLIVALMLHNYMCERVLFNLSQVLHHETLMIIIATVATIKFIDKLLKRKKGV